MTLFEEGIVLIPWTRVGWLYYTAVTFRRLKLYNIYKALRRDSNTESQLHNAHDSQQVRYANTPPSIMNQPP